MESQDKEKEYEDNVWEIYRKEWATASPEKKIELNKRMRHWQELMKDGWTAQQAYYKAMEGELDFRVAEEPLDKSPSYSFWANMRKPPLIFLGLALVVAIVYCIVITGDRNALNTKLESVQSILASTQADLDSKKTELADKEQKLTSTQSELVSTQLDLDSTQLDLDSTEAELSSTKQKLSSTQTELSSTEQTLISVQSELGATKQELATTEAERLLYKETLDGLRVEVYSGIQQPPVSGGELIGRPDLKNNPAATNPSWGQLMNFLLSDPTDDKTYSKYTFNCVSFAEMLHNNAEDARIKSAFVSVDFKNNPIGHALNAFITTNRGLVYVDCTGVTEIEASRIAFYERFYGYIAELDRMAFVVAGKEYGGIGINDVFISPEYSYYEDRKEIVGSEWVPMGIVESIEIYW